MPHTMPKQPTKPPTPKNIGFIAGYYKCCPAGDSVKPHASGETGRQLAERLRAEAAKPKRKPRAKKAAS